MTDNELEQLVNDYVTFGKKLSELSKEELKIVAEKLEDIIHLDVEKGKVNALLGPSGFGKTQLLNYIYSLESNIDKEE